DVTWDVATKTGATIACARPSVLVSSSYSDRARRRALTDCGEARVLHRLRVGERALHARARKHALEPRAHARVRREIEATRGGEAVMRREREVRDREAARYVLSRGEPAVEHLRERLEVGRAGLDGHFVRRALARQRFDDAFESHFRRCGREV